MKSILALNTGNTKFEIELLGRLFDDVRAMLGCYKGQKENRYLITYVETSDGSMRAEEWIKLLAKSFNQESVLFIDDNRTAMLHRTKEDIYVALGKWQKNTEALPDCWTQDKQTKVYYVCK